MPLRCASCGHNFHQPWILAWLGAATFVPTSLLAAGMGTLFSLVFPSIPSPYGLVVGFALALALEHVASLVYVNRFKPLVSGPRYG
jgi:hypothetical protein